jgi:hypothetical protein
MNIKKDIDNYFTFYETPVFMEDLQDIEGKESLNLLFAIQEDLLEDPTRGDIVQGTGGARKARIADPKSNKGKSGSYRYLYLYFEHHGQIYLLYIFAKNKQVDLTPDQKDIIAQWVQAIKGALK